MTLGELWDNEYPNPLIIKDDDGNYFLLQNKISDSLYNLLVLTIDSKGRFNTEGKLKICLSNQSIWSMHQP